jgi:glutamate carboxypeptidase
VLVKTCVILHFSFMRSLFFVSPTLLLFSMSGLLAGQNLSTQEKTIVTAIDEEAPAAVLLLERIVNMNSGTFNPAGVKQVGDVLETEFKSLGFETRWVSMEAVNRAPHLVAERKGANGKRVLIIGHMDTVFEPSSPFQKFVRNGDIATGPGVVDMKGGIVVMLSALKAMHKAGALDGSSITVFLTADEESVGGPVSREQFIEAAKNSDAALCFEAGARDNGKDYASTARRGSTTWELRVAGKTGHSSGIFSERVGDGAVYELSRILNAFHDQLREPNLTFSVGVVLGGSEINLDAGGHGRVSGKPNIIPGEALARGDIRALTSDQLARVKDKMQSILSKNLPGTRAEMKFSDSYPPMAPTDGNIALLTKLNEANRKLGAPEMEALDPMLRGAGDASFVAPYVDTLSGLGANGGGTGGSHAPGESANLARLPLQTKRAALLIYGLTKEPGR